MSSQAHDCPATGCTRRVGRDYLMCRNHWMMVPKDLRDRVWDAWYGPGPGSLEHSNAIRAATRAVNDKIAARRHHA